MSMELMVKALKLKIGNQGRKLVLIKLADNANDQGECWPSYQYIADICEMSKRSAISHIKKLEDMGLLRRESRITQNGQSSNMYYLTLGSGETIQWSSRKKEGVKNIPTRGENISPPSENVAPRGGENISPRTYHSLEPVNKQIQGCSKQVTTPELCDPRIENTWKNIQDYIDDVYGINLHTRSQSDIDSIKWSLGFCDVWDDGVFLSFCHVVESQLGKAEKVLNPLQRAMAAEQIPEFRWQELIEHYEESLNG